MKNQAMKCLSKWKKIRDAGRKILLAIYGKSYYTMYAMAGIHQNCIFGKGSRKYTGLSLPYIKDKAMPAGRTGEQQKKFHRCRGTKTNGKEWITMNLPKDPAILLSFVNTHLRDRYPSLEEFCKSTGVPMEEVTDALAAIDYYYQPDRNQFI